MDIGAIKPLDAKELTTQVQLIHTMLAGMTRNPVFMLSEMECSALANSVAEVSKHYNVSGFLTGPAMAWVGLAGTCFMIYGPRVKAMRDAKRRPAPAAAPATPEDVITPSGVRVDFSADAAAFGMQ